MKKNVLGRVTYDDKNVIQRNEDDDGHGIYCRSVVISGGVTIQTRTHYCIDCGKKYPNIYMVHDALWLSVAAKRDILCLSCFQKRLGRKVTRDDLKRDVECNELAFLDELT